MTDRRLPSSHRPLVLGALGALGLLFATSPAGALTLAAAAATDLNKDVAAEGLGEPTDVAELPDGRLVVIERQGNVKTFMPGVDDPVQDHIDVDSSHNERGLLGIVIDQDFASNQFVYFYASQGNDAANRQKILRYKLGTDGKLSALKPVIDMGLQGPANHNGGGISVYGKVLFVGVGDTGKNNATPHNHFASCLNLANGKVLRVSIADDNTLGQPLADNPLMNVAMVTGCDNSGSGDNEPFVMRAPEKRIYAWGFRNPFRLWADPTTGKVWVGDVGEEKKEEVSVVEKGKHYGYPFFEGTTAYTAQQQPFQPNGACMGMTPASECVGPVTEHDRAAGGASIGGRILDGCNWPDTWKKRYIYGDHEQGKIWSVDVNATRDGVVANSVKDFATANNPVAIRMGTSNALYVVERNGSVSRITAKAAPPAVNSCPGINGMPSSGAGGSGAGGMSAGGSAGAPATGGAGNPGGTNATGGGGLGSTGLGGAPSTPGAGSGTTPQAGNSGTSAGAGNGADSGDSGGCGCRMAGGSGSSALALGALVSALGLALSRRRNRQS